MRVISVRRLREFWESGHPEAELPMRTWYSQVETARWKNYPDVKADYGKHVDLIYGKYIFDVAGNDYRVICYIDFERHGVLIRWVGTHYEYDKLNERGGNGPKGGLGLKDV